MYLSKSLQKHIDEEFMNDDQFKAELFHTCLCKKCRLSNGIRNRWSCSQTGSHYVILSRESVFLLSELYAHYPPGTKCETIIKMALQSFLEKVKP